MIVAESAGHHTTINNIIMSKDTQKSVEELFDMFRPVCIKVTKDHNELSVDSLHKMLSAQELVADEPLAHLQEYIAFPLRIVLKQFCARDERLCVATLRCLGTLVRRAPLLKSAIFLDLFNTLLTLLSPPVVNAMPERKSTEDVKVEICKSIDVLVSACSASVCCSLYTEGLPLLGAAISVCLSLGRNENSKDLQLSALGCLERFLDCKKDKQLRECIESALPAFLPGITLGLTHVITDPKRASKVVRRALRCFGDAVVCSLPDRLCLNVRSKDDSSIPTPPEKSLLVIRTSEWLSMTAMNVSLLIKRVCTVCAKLDNWAVRSDSVEWAFSLLKHCWATLSSCQDDLLDVLIRHLGDEYPQVAALARQHLSECRLVSDTIDQVLKERIYSMATSLPRLLRVSDEEDSLAAMRLFNGYLQALGHSIRGMLNSHAHLTRISLALIQILELDSSGLQVLEAIEPGSLQLTGELMTRPVVMKKTFALFSDDRLWVEIKSCCHLMSEFGSIYFLVDHFLSTFTSSKDQKIPVALILNELLYANVKKCVEDRTDLVEACCYVIDEYMLAYQELNCATPSGLKAKNEQILLTCLLLEGTAIIHQVAKQEEAVLMIKSLYTVLEAAGSTNVMINQSAVLTLHLISSAVGCSGPAQLIQKHSDFLVNALSLNIRRLHRYPNSPQVLQSMIVYCEPTILPYLEHILIEILITLDHNYQCSALPLLRILQVLLRRMKKWFVLSHPPINSLSHGHIAHVVGGEPPTQKPSHIPSPEMVTSQNSCSEDHLRQVVKRITGYIREYYRDKLRSQNLSSSDSDIDEPIMEENTAMGEAEDHMTLEEDRSEPIPLHINLANKVLERCKHLVSHNSPKIRLITLDMIADGCCILNELQNQLLPMIHQLWPGFCQRFRDAEVLVIFKAADCLSVMGEVARDFIRTRVAKEVLPGLCDCMVRLSKTSVLAGKAYLQTNDFKLQLRVLSSLGQLCSNIDVSDNALEAVLSCVLPYLNPSQPEPLQKAAHCAINSIAAVDADCTWYRVMELKNSVKNTDVAAVKLLERLEILLREIGTAYVPFLPYRTH